MIGRFNDIRPDQYENLKKLTSQHQLKLAKLVRKGIDLVMKKQGAGENWLVETRKIRGVLENDVGLDEKFVEARRSINRASAKYVCVTNSTTVLEH